MTALSLTLGIHMARKVDLEKNKFHLLAVSVAADLSDVKAEGEAISLEAMNAKVLVARAGTMALGFRPLTDFMVELADDTIRLVNEIEFEALAVSLQAVERLRTLNAVNQAQRALVLAEGAPVKHIGGLNVFVKKALDLDNARVEQLLDHAVHLTSLLEEISEQMIAACAVASSARIEAAAIEPRYSASFNSVSTNLQRCAEAVLKKVKASHSLLSQALNMTGNYQ